MTKAELKKIMGENVCKMREAHGMTIMELARQMEITPGYLGLIERGKRGLTAYMVLKLSQLFNMSIDRFFTDGDVTYAGGVSEKNGLICFMPVIVFPRKYMKEIKEEIKKLKKDAELSENRAFELIADVFSTLKDEESTADDEVEDEEYDEDEE